MDAYQYNFNVKKFIVLLIQPPNHYRVLMYKLEKKMTLHIFYIKRKDTSKEAK